MHRQMMKRFASMALLAGALTIQASGSASAAQQSAVSPNYGEWVDRDTNTKFELRPGQTPDHPILVVPATVIFPGNHQYVLSRRDAKFYISSGRDRPAASLSFASSALAALKLNGAGTSSTGSWVSNNDFVLVHH